MNKVKKIEEVNAVNSSAIIEKIINSVNLVK